MKPNTTSWMHVSFAGALLTAGLLAGCQTDGSSVQDFFPADEERSIDRINKAQAASGARADATLQSFHFDGERLNSLGEAKLDLMLKDDDTAEPVVVYVNLLKDDPDLKARRDAVTDYLTDRGLTKDQIEFRLGNNPNNSSLAVTHSARMGKLESTAAGEGAAGGEGNKSGNNGGGGASGGGMSEGGK